MEKYLLLAIIASFLWSEIFAAESEPTGPLDPKCLDYAIPVPPCCGANFLNAESEPPYYDANSLSAEPETPYYGANFLNARRKGGKPRPPGIPINKTAGEFPWWVTVVTNIGGGFYSSCIGSILNTRWVITAAHCAASRHSAIMIKLDYFRYILADIIVSRADMALMHLEKPLIYDRMHAPVCLPIGPLKKKNYHLTNATQVGWGDHKERVRRDVLVKEAGPTKPDVLFINPHVCKGSDSGGGLIMQSDENPRKIKAYYIIGTLRNANTKFDYIQKVPGFMEWIKSVLTTDPDDFLPN